MEYSLEDYIKYENSHFSDETKKKLEIANIKEIMSHFKNKEHLVSLDIGCATCRYPKYFSSIGFSAFGYDINDEIVNLYSKKLESNKNITIKNKNVLTSTPEKNKYNVITCMMGTFNHFNKKEKKYFIKWTYESLKKDGLLIFSIWNPDSYYLNLLSLYNREQVEFINNNLIKSSELIKLLEENKFNVKNVKPTSLMPNICYEAWGNDLRLSDIQNIEKYLGKFFESDKNSQMLIIQAKK